MLYDCIQRIGYVKNLMKPAGYLSRAVGVHCVTFHFILVY